jgi:hypothetical protein
MKRYLILSLICAAALLGAVTVHSLAHADDVPPMTEAHITRIRNNCVEAQSALNQLHASDALLRVNRGQLYESISVKLMAPFNGRIALNRLDGAQLVSTATDYERELIDFRIKYQQYEEAMSKTLQINCINEPVAFYDSVNDTRTKRQKVHTATALLHATIGNYKDQFEVFAKDFEEKHQ